MPIRKLTDTLYIAPQLTEADVQEAVRLGIKTIICNLSLIHISEPTRRSIISYAVFCLK